MAKKGIGDIRLGRLELQIMNVVWEKGKATVHDVKEALGSGRTPAYSTILTMMRKIEAKGYLTHETENRTFIYQATITQKDVRKNLLGDILDRLFKGSPALLMDTLVDQKTMAPEELQEIKRLIGEAEKK